MIIKNKLPIIPIVILVVVVAAGLFVWKVNPLAALSPVEVIEISKPNLSGVLGEDAHSVNLLLFSLVDVDDVTVVFSYDWVYRGKSRPESFRISENVTGKNELEREIRFESCSADCYFHDVEEGIVDVTLENDTGGEWRGTYEFVIEEASISFTLR